MGCRGQYNRDRAAGEEWAKLPLRERYDWHGIAVTLATVVAIVLAVFVLPRPEVVTAQAPSGVSLSIGF